MIKWIEATGKNEEAAIASALRQLNMDRDDVSVELLERAKKGLLGFGATPAKVRVSYEVPDEEPKHEAPIGQPVKEVVRPAAPKQKQTVETKKAPEPMEKKPAGNKPTEETPEAPQKADTHAESEPVAEEKSDEVEKRIREFLTGLMDHMGVHATPNIEKRPEGGYLIVLEGEKLGALIGHRGETLDAIQQLTNYAVNRGRTRRVRIHIDVENYRAKREESLRRLAEKVAAKVVKYRRNVTLEPMNAYERHVIHEALQDYPDVVTYSTGSEPNRRTVVAYSRGKHTY